MKTKWDESEAIQPFININILFCRQTWPARSSSSSSCSLNLFSSSCFCFFRRVTWFQVVCWTGVKVIINEDQTSSWSAPLFSRSATSLPRLLILSSLYSTSSFIAWTFVLSQGCKTSFSFMSISYFDLRLWMWQPECDTVWHKGRSLSREHPPFHIQAGWSNIQHSTVLVTVKSIAIADRAIVNPDNVIEIFFCHRFNLCLHQNHPHSDHRILIHCDLSPPRQCYNKIYWDLLLSSFQSLSPFPTRL